MKTHRRDVAGLFLICAKGANVFNHFCSFHRLSQATTPRIKAVNHARHEGMCGVTLLSESENVTISSNVLSGVPRKTALCNKWP